MKIIQWPHCPFDEILLNPLFSDYHFIDQQFIENWNKNYKIQKCLTEEHVREAACRAILSEYIQTVYPEYNGIIKTCYFIGIERETGEFFCVDSLDYETINVNVETLRQCEKLLRLSCNFKGNIDNLISCQFTLNFQTVSPCSESLVFL